MQKGALATVPANSLQELPMVIFRCFSQEALLRGVPQDQMLSVRLLCLN